MHNLYDAFSYLYGETLALCYRGAREMMRIAGTMVPESGPPLGAKGLWRGTRGRRAPLEAALHCSRYASRQNSVMAALLNIVRRSRALRPVALHWRQALLASVRNERKAVIALGDAYAPGMEYLLSLIQLKDNSQ